jgi:putative sigma-54 modulation protein
MNLTITGRHVEISDVVRKHVEERLANVSADWPRTQSVHVILNLEKQTLCIAEVVVQVPRHGTVEAKEESHDMYRSVDQAIEKVDRQIRRWKEKVQEAHKTHPGLGASERTAQDQEG